MDRMPNNGNLLALRRHVLPQCRSGLGNHMVYSAGDLGRRLHRY